MYWSHIITIIIIIIIIIEYIQVNGVFFLYNVKLFWILVLIAFDNKKIVRIALKSGAGEE
jgi:hypothetical protein